MSALDVKKHGGLDRSWRLPCRALLSVFLLGVPSLASDGVIPVLVEVSPLAIRGAEKLNVDSGSTLAGQSLRKRRRRALGQLDLVAKRRGGAAGLGDGIHARATTRRAIGAGCGGLGFGLGLAAKATKGLCCFVFHGSFLVGSSKSVLAVGHCFFHLATSGGGSIGLGNLAPDSCVMFRDLRLKLSAGGDDAVVVGLHDADRTEARYSNRMVAGHDALAGKLPSAVDVEGGDDDLDSAIAALALVIEFVSDFKGHFDLCSRSCCPFDGGVVGHARKIPNRLGLSRKDLNYFHGPNAGSFSPLNA